MTQSDLFSETDTSAVLFGADPTDRVVAAEQVEDRLLVWRRPVGNDGPAVPEERRVPLWILTAEPEPLLDVPCVDLEGSGYHYLYEFAGASAFQDARFRLRDAHADHVAYGNATKAALIRSGITLFKGMAMQDVVRMQVDIETTSLTWDREGDRILIIAVSDNRGLLETLTGEEPEMLQRLVELVRERDPDVIEGHNIYGFDIPFLMARAARHGVRLGLGRDGSEVRCGTERNFAIGGIARPFVPAYLFGRHVIDTYLAVQRFDWARGALTSYGLKQVAQAFGLAEADRVEMPRAELAAIFQRDKQRVLDYARHDVIETGRVAELVTPTEFYQTQMVPDSYGAVAVTGTGEKINAIFIRAYLTAGRAIPRPAAPKPYPGGYTEVRLTGVLDRVVKADVESLYPSIMLADRIRPASDTLDVFLPALAELTRRRLEAKAHARDATGTDQHFWDGLQNSFKVLINSFYGYLGAGSFHFNDFDAARRVTERGRELVVHIADTMEATGSRVIEIDTDGVYFVPPDGVQGGEAERAYVAEIGAGLPAGIRLAFDGRYRAMVSLKTKNYVLEGYDGKKIYRGASLRSRADEAYGREFIAAAVDLLLAHRIEEIGALYERTIADILEHRIPIDKLARRERVTHKTRTSSAKRRSADVAGDTAIGDYITVYERKRGDVCDLARLDDYTPNSENTTYYMEKLYKFALRLREAFEAEFDRLIPKPTPQGLTSRLQISMDDLFA